MKTSWSPQLNHVAEKEHLYRGFWGGVQPGTILIHASRQKRKPASPPKPPNYNGDDSQQYFAYHLACEQERLDSRDWEADDAIPMVAVPPGPTGIFATAFGSRYDPVTDWTHQCLKSPHEIRRMKLPRLSDGLVGKYLDGIRYTAEAIKDNLPVCCGQCNQGPLSTASMILDDQALLEAMYTHPSEIHLLLRMVTEYLIEFMATARRLLPRPVSSNFLDVYLPAELGVGISDDLAAVVSPRLYEEFSVPYLNQISDAFGGLFLHSCGNPNMNFPGMRNIHNFRGIEVGATECPVEETINAFTGSAVVAFHIGLNTKPHFASRLACAEHIVNHAKPNSSIFINTSSYYCSMPTTTWDEWNKESQQIVGARPRRIITDRKAK